MRPQGRALTRCKISAETPLEEESLGFRQVTRTSDGLVTIEVNIAARNHREAALSIGLALFVIIELMVFISVLNNTAMDLLVKPVAHILHVIRTQAQKVMAALDTDEVPSPAQACMHQQ